MESKRLAFLAELTKFNAVFEGRKTRPDSEKPKLDFGSIVALLPPLQGKIMGGLERAKSEVTKLNDAEAEDFIDAAHWYNHIVARENTVRLVEDFAREMDQEFAKFVEETNKLMGEESPWAHGAPEFPYISARDASPG